MQIDCLLAKRWDKRVGTWSVYILWEGWPVADASWQKLSKIGSDVDVQTVWESLSNVSNVSSSQFCANIKALVRECRGHDESLYVDPHNNKIYSGSDLSSDDDGYTDDSENDDSDCVDELSNNDSDSDEQDENSNKESYLSREFSFHI